MATTIQIIVAGVLLLAWVWVLGRPLIGGVMGRRRYEELDGPFGESDARGPSGVADVGTTVPASTGLFGRAGRGLLRWWRRPVEVRRRQFMLATMFATFASFLMAIALRGRFVYLFLMMAGLLVVHLITAAIIGGRMTAANRAVFVADAKTRVRAASEGITIRARQAGDDAFQRASETVTLLGPDEEPESVGVTSYVSDLIDLEWGADQVAPPEPAAEPAAASTDAGTPEPAAEPTDTATPARPAAETAAAEPAPGTAAAADGQPAQAGAGDVASADDAPPATPEPIFTRAAKDAPARWRRRAKPIYIESQLDDGDEVAAAKAVNQD